jgi:hypothetical protein
VKITKRQLRRIIWEAMELDLEVGDVILTGKFKNKRKVVKDFGKDDLGQPTINGMKALNFRIEKLMPKDKWSKESKEALEFADKVDEMKITKRQLRRIIREANDPNYSIGLGEFSSEEEAAGYIVDIVANSPPGTFTPDSLIDELHQDGMTERIATDLVTSAYMGGQLRWEEDGTLSLKRQN